MTLQRTKLKIVVIEDDSEDVKALERNLIDSKLAYEMTVFPTGKKAMEYLNAQSETENALSSSLPHLILLDLDLPGEHGIHILGKLKRHPSWRSVPVGVLSKSEDVNDFIQTYRQGGVVFLKKPCDKRSLLELITQLKTQGQIK